MCSKLKVSIILKKNCLEKLLNATMFSYNRKKYKQLMQNVSQTRDLLWSHGFVTISRVTNICVNLIFITVLTISHCWCLYCTK